MQTYTLLFRDGSPSRSVRAISIEAPSAGQALFTLRSMPIRDCCELWSEGRYICSLQVFGALGVWCTITAEPPAADVVQSDSQTWV
jgi:hypothetical protein